MGAPDAFESTIPANWKASGSQYQQERRSQQKQHNDACEECAFPG